MLIRKLMEIGFVKRFAEQTGWKLIDTKATEKWPKAWPALKRSVSGWKTLTGLAILNWPLVVAFAYAACEEINKAAALVGLSWNIDPMSAMLACGQVLVIIGALDKGLKFLLVLMGNKVDALPNKPVIQTEAEHEAFLNHYARLRASGTEWQQARKLALEFVLQDRGKVK